MKISIQKIQRLTIASALASGLMTFGVAVSAQTTAAPIASPATTATTVSMSTVDVKATRRAELEEANADARRVAFRHQGTSL